MMRFLALGIGLGIGLAVWTARPPMVEATGAGFAWLLLLVLVVVYRAGKSKREDYGNASATAVATAQANASQTINVNVAGGARDVAAREHGGLDEVTWQGDAVEVIDAEDADELMDELEHDPSRALEARTAGAGGQSAAADAHPTPAAWSPYG